MSKFTDHLWRDLVREHGPALAHAARPEPGRARRPRPRVLAGSTLGLAGVAAALTLGLTATASQPAFAVTRHHDGSVSVKINQRSGIAGANRELAAMGIHERVMAVSDGQPIPLNCMAPGPGWDGKSLVIKGYPQVSTGPVSSLSGTSGNTGSGNTGTSNTGSGNTGSGNTGSGNTGSGGPGVGTTWHVVACSSGVGNTGSGNTGAG
jgi:hypothetical protein